MSGKINWQNLKPWDGSQHTAFEELCCQLAHYEPQPKGSIWKRKGAPDAGVECLWIQPDGKNHGWQSKFFLSQPDEGQWKQLDESVGTALAKHPELTSYTICLPCDRQDPRIPKQEWFMDKWDKHVEKWEGWAVEKGMAVRFIYWGESEICERLAREKHHGRYKFWFDKEQFSDEWFQHNLKKTLDDAGPRYSPLLNVGLPIAKVFDGLGRTKAFHLELVTLRGKIRQAWHDAVSCGRRMKYADRCQPLFEHVQPLIEKLQNLILHNGPYDRRDIDRQSIEQTASEVKKAIQQLYDDLEKLRVDLEKLEQEQQDARDKNLENLTENPGAQSHRSLNDVFNSFRYYLNKLQTELYHLQSFIESPAARLFNIPLLLIHAKAGKGKTHLLCDVAKARLNEGLPTVVLLGEKFVEAEPWNQVLKFLGLNCTPDEFLGAMEAAAQARGGRALIFIDALNEGEGKTLWRKHLAGLLSDIEKFPNLGLAVSVRSSYEDLVIPDQAKNRLERIEHQGFSGHEYKATRTFFAYYGIALPAVPLLHPEWSDPLFLRLFCQGLKNAGMTSLPEGWHGITQIFDFFLDSINTQLALPERLDFDKQHSLVHKAAQLLAKTMSDQQRQWLPRDVAQSLVDGLLPRTGYQQTLFRNLLAEGVLTEERFLTSNNLATEGTNETAATWEIGVRFGFERFFDHLQARYLLDTYFDADNPAQIFAPDGAIGKLFTKCFSLWYYQGLLEALTIQVPERCVQELPFLLSEWADNDEIIEAFLDGLLWRTTASITEETKRYINEHVVNNHDGHEKLLDVFLTLASRSDHPYNAEFLHAHLIGYEMADRDAWWSIYLHEQYKNESALDRLLDWAQSEDDKSHINDESVRLCAVMLIWCLTSSNRFVRDRATKGLVALLWERLHLLLPLLLKFKDVNDPYVQERLLAVCYGCCLRTQDDNGIKFLAQYIFKTIFKAPHETDAEVWPHILGRDYARGVVEIALHRKLFSGEEAAEAVELARPPYRSAWPSNFPDEEAVKDLLKKSLSVSSSLSSMGDFRRYIVDSRLGDYNWSIRRLSEPPPLTLKERADAFIATLDSNQLQAWEKYRSAKGWQDNWCHTTDEKLIEHIKIRWDTNSSKRDDGNPLSPLPADEVLLTELSSENPDAQVKETEKAFFSLLSPEQRAAFEVEALPHFMHPYITEEPFNSGLLLPWIAQKVFELGWTQERFGRFDQNQNYPMGDSPYKAERIGKKYQWIALHEIAARVADNFYMKDERDWQHERSVRTFDGPWQPSFRDIDPSILLSGTKGNHKDAAWWLPASYTHWYAIEDDKEWLKTHSDLPPVKPMLEVTNPNDSKQWLSLDFTVRPHEPEHPGEERFSRSERNFCFTIKSYLVHRENKEKFWQWAIEQNFMVKRMPETHELRDVFWGELFWASSFLSQNESYYGRNGWTSNEDETLYGWLPAPILLTVDEWVQDARAYDCSLEESARITIPCEQLAIKMGLTPRREGEWVNGDNKVIAFDPSVFESGPSTLLIQKDSFLAFLDENDYDIVWIILGEKRITTPSFNPQNRLEISGAACFNSQELTVKTTAKFIKR